MLASAKLTVEDDEGGPVKFTNNSVAYPRSFAHRRLVERKARWQYCSNERQSISVRDVPYAPFATPVPKYAQCDGQNRKNDPLHK